MEHINATSELVLKSRVYVINKKKQLRCPKCPDGQLMQYNNSDQIHIVQDKSMPTVVAIVCPSCRSRRPGKVWVCTSCERYNKKISMLKMKCNCTTQLDDETAQVEENADDTSKVGMDEYITEFDNSYDVEEGSHDAVMDGDVLENNAAAEVDAAFDPTLFFTEANGWPKNSAAYFIAEHNNPGFGKKALVGRAMSSNPKAIPNPDSITDQQLWYTLHCTARFVNMTRDETINVCTMIDETHKMRDDAMALLNKSFTDAIRLELKDRNEPTNLDAMIDRITKTVSLAMNPLDNVTTKLPIISEEKDVRRLYTEGEYSVCGLLPRIHAKVVTIDEEHEYACFDVEQLIDHSLAHGTIDLHYYRSGEEFETDWDASTYIDPRESNRSKVLSANFFRETHEEVKSMNLSSGTRVVMVRGWNDAFEARHVTANNEYNSIQTYTIRLKGKKDHTLPVALCFKKQMHGDILISIIEQLNMLKQPKRRYWGADRKVYDTVIFFELQSADHPDRCWHSGHANVKGTYSKRFAHSCLYDGEKTPTCQECLSIRSSLLLDKTCDHQALQACQNCTDWFSDDKPAPSVYPVPPGFDIVHKDFKAPNVKLSYEMIENSIANLQKWFEDNKGKYSAEAINSVLDRYFQLLCLGKGSELRAAMKRGDNLKEQDFYPFMLREHNRLGIKFEHFPSMVMHLFFLGIMKSLISQSNRIHISARTNAGRLFWYALMDHMSANQAGIDKLSVGWCLAMSFSKEKERKIGTTGWMSDHYIGFNRACLFHYLPLVTISAPASYNAPIKAFTRLIVLWFCLVANVFCDGDYVSEIRIDHLVRIFLSSCVDFHAHAKDGDDKLFFLETTNFFSLLNCKELIERFGTIRYLWEGLDEKFIKWIKREITVIRHETSHLKTILNKILISSTLNDLNEPNPLREVTLYARLGDFKIYKKGKGYSNPNDVITQDSFVSGIIDNEGKLYICFESGRGKGIDLHQISFSDERGLWRLNLWYAPPMVADNSQFHFSSKSELSDFPADHFVMFCHSFGDDEKGTVICHSWRVRLIGGILSVPMPQEQYLFL